MECEAFYRSFQVKVRSIMGVMTKIGFVNFQ